MKFTIDEKFQNKSLEEVLKALYIPKKELHWLRMSKDIKVNDQECKLNVILKENDEVYLPDFIQESAYIKSNKKASIVYEDQNIVVAEKPAGQKVHPNDENEHDTLVNDVINTVDSNYVEAVHRLDADTTGIVLLAKNAYMKKILDHMLANNQIRRIYKAHVKKNSGIRKQTIKAPLGRKPYTNIYHVTRDGKSAITHILSSQKKEHYDVLTVELETGRTHQIRAHLNHLNAPIIGDKLYGGSTAVNMHLFGYQLSFINPLDDKELTVTMKEK